MKKNNNINRIIDANINRAKEGLRVAEEVTRFILNNRVFTKELKKIRHDLDTLAADFGGSLKELLKQRDSREDVGKDIYEGEFKRRNLRDIFFANMQRVKESIRVLEEFSKLKDTTLAVKFKKIRYHIYVIESTIGKRL